MVPYLSINGTTAGRLGQGFRSSLWATALTIWLCSCAGNDQSNSQDAAFDQTGDAAGETADSLGPDIVTHDLTSDADSLSDQPANYPWDDHSLTIMSFNVMCSFCKNDPEGNEPWKDRVPHFGDIISRHAPDLIGLQELTTSAEIAEIQGVAPGYAAAFVSGLPVEPLTLWTEYPDATILFRQDRFTLMEQGHYWLSPTPGQDWALGWASTNIWRIVVWVRLKQVSDGREIYFANTHFDNNVPNQEMSAPLALAKTEPWAEQMAVVFVGDFNSKPGSPAYTILTGGTNGEGFRLANSFDQVADYRVETNLAPVPQWNPEHRIDHIFLAGTPQWATNDWVVDLSAYGPDSQYPSDHFPIVATANW